MPPRGKLYDKIDARDETRRAIYCGRPASEGLYVLPFLSNCRSKMITYVFHYLRGSRGHRLDLRQLLAERPGGHLQVVVVLEVEPELRCGAERLAQPQGVIPVVPSTMGSTRVRGTSIFLASAPAELSGL